MGIFGTICQDVTRWLLLDVSSRVATTSGCRVDANDSLYPILWTIVENKSINTWSWFMDLLTSGVDIPNTPGWTFMYNRQKVHLNPKSCT